VNIPNLGTGDIEFSKAVKATEEGEEHAFVNQQGKKIAVLNSEGNFHIKGDLIKDL